MTYATPYINSPCGLNRNTGDNLVQWAGSIYWVDRVIYKNLRLYSKNLWVVTTPSADVLQKIPSVDEG